VRLDTEVTLKKMVWDSLKGDVGTGGKKSKRVPHGPEITTEGGEGMLAEEVCVKKELGLVSVS